jgi:Ni/Fe-hydrogenase subunit HybB-like protein
MSEESVPIGGRIFTKPFAVLLLLFLYGVALIIYRYINGLGAVTNLSDGYPWGIWITYDVLVGTAFGCGGYAMALLVYILNKGEYHPLVRSAVLTSAFGYTLAAVAIFVDIGRYWNGYNLFLPWYINVNSIMLEVALCIAAYCLVLWIEFVPAVLEGWNDPVLPFLKKIPLMPKCILNLDAPKWQAWLGKWLFVIVALGFLLPTMHQSSLGTLMVIAGRKLSPLWQTGWLPLFNLLSALLMGYAIVVFESMFSSIGFKRPLETPLISKVSGVMAIATVVYLVIRFLDVIFRGALGLAFAGNLQGNMFLLENLLFVVPVVLMANPQRRNSLKWLFVGAVSLLLGGSLFRFDAFLVGFNPGPGWTYFPAFSELMITVGIVALELMLYLIFVKKLPVLPKLEHGPKLEHA